MAQDQTKWNDYAEAFAFFGNTLLAPMNQTSAIGLDPAFWVGFPKFDDDQVAEALFACREFAEASQARAAKGENIVQQVSVEYTELFVGPPKPAAAPWETFYKDESGVGFGIPTFTMQRLLREAGLVVSNENNQYADHIGIELLYLSVLCTRAATDRDAADAAVDFAQERVRTWIGDLEAKVAQAAPKGYIDTILLLAMALLNTLTARR